jgi:uncharacterized membrane protein (DUF106 family)
MRQRHILMILWIVVLAIGLFWNNVPVIKNTVHAVFDPTLGALLDANIFWGMLGIIIVLNLIMIFVQKYATDQEALKRLKKEQKDFQKQIKQFKDDPQKMLELNQKQFEFFKETFRLTSRSWTYTLIPFVLLFRWFTDYFANVSYEFFGFFSWFWFYLIASIVITSIFRKVFDVA